MSESPQIAAGKIVIIHYTLRDDDGEVLDSSRERGPMPYLHGARNIVPGLEEAIAEHAVGDSFTVDVPPAKGYGERSGLEAQPVPRAQVPPEAQPGMQLWTEVAPGQRRPVWVERLDDEHAYLTSEHPMAGKTLHFECEIIGAREATADEKAHGHAHGLDGRAHHGHGADRDQSGRRSLRQRSARKGGKKKGKR